MKRIFMVGYSTDKGGVEAYIENLCKQLSKEKYKVVYDWPVMNIDGKEWIRPKNRHNYLKYYLFWKKFFKKNKFDVLYYNTCDIVSIDMLKFAKKAGVPVRIIHSHNTGNQLGIEKKMSRIHQITEKNNRVHINKYATKLLACSEAAGIWMFGNHKFTLIHNGISLSKYSYNLEYDKKIRSGIGDEFEFIVGCIGRLDPQKNPLYSLKIAEKLINQNPNIKFVFIGNGELMQQLHNQIKEKKLENNIDLIGAVDNVNEWLSALDCLVMPSLFEGLPFALVEAQASGLPCIVSNNVSTETNLTGLIQYLELSEDVQEWVDSIMSVINKDRIDTHTAIIEAGYSIDNTVKEVCSIIEGENCD